MEIITIEAKTFEAMMMRVEVLSKKMDALLCERNKTLARWMDGREVCLALSISKRTLQTYRDYGTLPYTRIEQKIFYKPEDIERVLTKNEK